MGGLDESWIGRLKMGQPAERLAAEFFTLKGWEFKPAGVEHDPQAHPNTPDFRVVIKGEPGWVEVKSRDSISRDSYEHCLTLDAKEPVVLLIKPDGATDALFAIRVADLKFTTTYWKNSTSSPTAGSGKPWKKIDLSAIPWTAKALITIPSCQQPLTASRNAGDQ